MRIIPSAPSMEAPPDSAQLEAFEKITAALAQKLRAIEERLKILEVTTTQIVHPPLPSRERTEVRDSLPPSPEANNPSSPPSPLKGEGVLQAPKQSRISVDSEALKKGLLTQMWKYLNDKTA